MSSQFFSASRLLIIFLIIASIGLCIYLASFFEFKEETIRLGASREARMQPFLAAEKFLQDKGLIAQSSFRLESTEDLAPGQVLVIDSSLHFQIPKRIEELYAWVEQGGQLIIGASSDEDEEDPLLNYIGASAYSDYDLEDSDNSDLDKNPNANSTDSANSQQASDEAQQSENKEAERVSLEEARRAANEILQANSKKNQPIKPREIRDELEANINEQSLTEVVLLKDGPVYKVHFYRNYSLWHPSLGEYEEGNFEAKVDYWAGDKLMTYWMEIPYGKGKVTIISDISIWHNTDIANFDHMSLLHSYTQGQTQILFLYGAEVPSIWQRLGRYFPEACLLLVLGLLFWLWRQSVQFGQIRRASDLNRRSLSEHVQASAHYLWRINARDKLIEDCRVLFFGKAYNAIPGLKSQSPSKQTTTLAILFNRSEQDIAQLLFAPIEKTNEQELLKIVSTLQTMWKEL